MKKIYKLSLLFIMIGAVLASCDMDRFPKTDIALPQSLQTIDDASYWNNGFLSSFRGRQYGIYTYVQERQADQLNATSDFGNRGGQPHSWINFLATDYDIRDIWNGYYFALKNINYFLTNSPEIKVEGDDAAKLKVYQGNAHFIRAYYYFNLAMRFGKDYKSASASSDLSVPMVTEYNVADKPARATNEAMYKFILDDIAAAKANLAGVAGKSAADFISIDAVTALEARVKLYMSDWAGAYAAATGLINGKKYPLVKPEGKSFMDMWRHDKSTEEILQLFVSKPDELPSTVITIGANASKGKCNPDWLPSQWIIDMYADNDLRKNVYFDANQTLEFGGLDYKGMSVITKYMGNPALAATDKHDLWGYIPDGLHAPKVFRIAEMYLIAAEAGFNSGKTDAVNYLNDLRVSRGLEAVQASGAALFKEIQDERTRELAFEGFRLWDLRRWNMPMKRHDPQMAEGADPYIHLSKGPNGYYTLSIEPNNPKWVWGIPSNDIKINTNLVQNQGW